MTVPQQIRILQPIYLKSKLASPCTDVVFSLSHVNNGKVNVIILEELVMASDDQKLEKS